ncbi:M16 family metallopeptidase [Alloalcanivorax sp. C16-2]|uniref:M16 family metallopeptidase n=1 Tax=Alloalcanivorax TaxID=3020832 RepID=UPI000C5D303D|nr:pitrilysin family protein [Alloalcanivorax marinus]MAO58812.1 peptidase M16 [Alcanivorax sp.]MBI56410.1 peptidase M16 [Alcanivorax sp.]MBL7252094.1 insulinase family protein [Alloalcanivorax marinus]HCE41432.1 peptidase M16 [Alcanivorax sp.]|tara:strand:- start:33941 stop:35263 length:1323 start_codon:yes stop_codon:yes gene_type:complete
MKKLWIALALSLVAVTARADLPTHEFQLDNGLDVLVREDHRAPVVTVMIWFKAGSIDEAPYETGVAHLLEHMMFRNSKHLAPGEFSRTVARFGGSDNAFTSFDFTAYYQQYEASRLPLALELEAERLKNLRIEDEDFQRELQVVMEERRQRTDDKPTALAWEKFQAVARPGTGYAHPIIGWRDQLAQLKPEQARSWYRRFYVPGNATLVIAGDVTEAEARPLVEKFFGAIAAGETPPRPEPTLNPPAGERRMTLRLPVRVPALYMLYNVPSLTTAEDPATFYALTMLGGVLDGGLSARVESNLVRGQRLAAGAGAGYDGLQRGNGTFTFSASPNPGVSLDDLEAAFEKEVRKIAEQPPSAEEMDRVRAGVLAGQVYQRDSVMGQAMELGRLSVLGVDWRLAEQFDDNLAKVTPEQVQQAARDWLVAERRAVAHVIPEEQQ